MKHKFLKALVIIIVIQATLANAGFLAYGLTHKTLNNQNGVPQATIKVKSSKQLDIGTGKQGVKAGGSDYKLQNLNHSRIDSTSDGGKLMIATYAPLGANFVLAANKSLEIGQDAVADGWQIQTIADDPLWAPGACSSKPTLLLKGRYVFIDDGKTKPTDSYNSYVIFDIQQKTYTYFGGDNFTGDQAKKENIMLVKDENDQLVFYIDQRDDTGPLADSTNFKHAAGSDHGYIIRRVIDPATMHFTDYHLNYTAPKSLDFYYLSMLGSTTSQDMTIRVTSDDNYDGYDGTISNDKVTFEPHQTLQVAYQAPTPPFDTEIEKKLDAPLAKALPNFLKGTAPDKSLYTTRFGVYELGEHDKTKFIIATSRYGDYSDTPVVYDQDSQTAYPLVKKASVLFSGAGNYVPMGVF